MRFTLTSLLALGLTSVALAQPATLEPTDDEQKVIDLIKKLDGKAEIDPRLPAAARVSAKFESATDAALMSLKKSPQVGSVDVYDATRCTEKGLVALKELPNLRRLILSKSEMTAARVNAIGQCRELRDVRLPGSGLSDVEVAGLKKLTLLESLDVSDNPQFTDKGLAAIKTLDRLRALYLAKTGITDKGLIELKGLEGLRTLYVGSTKVTPNAADKFADEMPNLRVVR